MFYRVCEVVTKERLKMPPPPALKRNILRIDLIRTGRFEGLNEADKSKALRKVTHWSIGLPGNRLKWVVP